MRKLRKNPELERLLDEWDEILKATGFKDIEKRIGHERVLVQYASNCYRQADPTTRETKESYYEQLSAAVQSHQFRDEIERFIMLQVADGARIKTIVELLSQMGHTIHRQTVRFVIRRHETLWGIKVWSSRQMNLKIRIK